MNKKRKWALLEIDNEIVGVMFCGDTKKEALRELDKFDDIYLERSCLSEHYNTGCADCIMWTICGLSKKEDR